MGRFLLSTILILFAAPYSFGQLQINAIGANNQITFDGTVTGVSNGSYAGGGFAPNPSSGQLDSDAWKVYGISNASGTQITSNYGDTNTGGDFALGHSTSPVSQGGIYAFSGSGLAGRTMGFQPSSDAFSGSTGSSVELRCINNTTQTITEILLSYRLYVRNDQNRSSLVSVDIFQDFFPVHTNVTQLDVPSLDATSALTNTGTNFSTLDIANYSASGVCIQPGEYFYVKWTIADAGGSGSRDEFALDYINIRALTGEDDITFYTQNTGEQLQTAGGSLEWSTVPSGNITFGMSPFITSADYVVQNGHTMTLKGSGNTLTLRDLTVESGGTLIADKNGNDASLVRYLTLFGDITCDGTIGSSSPSIYPGAGIGFNFEPGDHLISGSGAFDASRMRKSDQNLLDGICNLTIDMDVALHFPGNALYNERNASGGGTNYFNVTINPGVLVKIDYQAGMDGSNPDLNNGVERGGTYDIQGTMEVERTFKMRTDNTSLPVSVIVRSNGILRAGQISAGGSGAAGHSLILEGSSFLDLTGYTSIAWTNFSPTNNVFTFEPNSTVRYSSDNSQYVLNELEYRNLILQGNGGTGNRQTLSPNGTSTQLTIREDLSITGNAKLIPGANTILINGAWNNYNEAGFTEGTSLVIFENLTPSASVINTNGGEIFNELEIRSGTTIMDSDVDVINAFDLNGILDLNANNLLIRSPGLMAPVNGSSFEMIISEDYGHLGSMTVNILTYSPPVDFPFGTSTGQPIYCRFDLNSGNAGQVTMATYGTPANNLPRPAFPEAVNNMIGNYGTVTDNQDATVDRFWSITATGTTVDADLSFSFLQSEMPSTAPYNTVSGIRAQRYDGSLDRWQPSLPGQVVIQNSPITGVHRIDVPNVTEFSPWAASSEDSPLPVELIAFNSKVVNEGIELEWTTASEINNSHFILNRFGEDGESKEVAVIVGNGNSSSQLEYSWLDSSPLEGLNYYQLIQVDYDGTESDEGTVVSLWKKGNILAVLSHAWNENGLALNTQAMSERLNLDIMDMNGRVIYQGSITSGMSSTPFTPTHSGIYIARLSDGHEVLSIKLPFTVR